MKYKSVTFEVFKEFRQEVEKQLGKSTKIFRLDRSGEYLSLEFQGYLRDNGIVTMNQTLLDMVWFMMSLAILPKVLLGYALETAVYVINRIPSDSVDVAPYEIWSNKKSVLSYMRVWDALHRWRELCQINLMNKSDKCLFVGYPKETRGYYFYHTLEQRCLFQSMPSS